MRHRRSKGLRRRYGRTAAFPGEYRPGEGVRIKNSHGWAPFRGETGIIVRYVPFGKYYMETSRHGRILVSDSDLEAL
jgi:hypothetical protein